MLDLKLAESGSKKLAEIRYAFLNDQETIKRIVLGFLRGENFMAHGLEKSKFSQSCEKMLMN